MARINVNPNFVEAKILLDVTSDIQRVRAKLSRVNNIMDFTRAGADFAPLAAALGCTAAEAATIYARYVSIKQAMDGVDFQNLSEIDQG